MNLNNNENFSCIDLFFSPYKNYIKEELPLSESFPYTYNPNRSKNYYTNVTINNIDLDFDILNEDIISQLKKFKNDYKTIVMFDNLSVLPNDYLSLLKGITKLQHLLTEYVYYN